MHRTMTTLKAQVGTLKTILDAVRILGALMHGSCCRNSYFLVQVCFGSGTDAG